MSHVSLENVKCSMVLFAYSIEPVQMCYKNSVEWEKDEFYFKEKYFQKQLVGDNPFEWQCKFKEQTQFNINTI